MMFKIKKLYNNGLGKRKTPFGLNLLITLRNCVILANGK